MELHMSALQAKQEGESMLKQQIMELSSKVDELQDDLYKQQALGESLQAERDELRQTVEEKSEHEAEVERLRESMAALSQVVIFALCTLPLSACVAPVVSVENADPILDHESCKSALKAASSLNCSARYCLNSKPDPGTAGRNLAACHICFVVGSPNASPSDRGSPGPTILSYVAY